MDDVSGLVTADDPRSHKERMLAGDWYWGPAPELLADQRRAATLTHEYGEALKDGFEAASAVFQELFGTPMVCFVKPPFTVNYGYHTSIGEGSFLNSGAMLLDDAPISLGERVLVGPSVQFLTAYHPLEAAGRRKQLTRAKPITIGSDAWIGGGAVILAGVTIGACAVVGAGSVVTRDVPAHTVVAGNPARVIRQLDPETLPA